VSQCVFLSRQGGLAKNEPLKTEEIDEYLYSYDILSRVVYIEIPVLFAFDLKFDPFKARIYLEPEYRLGLFDVSNL
jgi:hypothetical protein